MINSLNYTITMKDFKFCFVLFFSVGVSSWSLKQIIIKADEKEKKMGFGRFYPESKTKVWELWTWKEIGF
jgi:hypothetical protein